MVFRHCNLNNLCINLFFIEEARFIKAPWFIIIYWEVSLKNSDSRVTSDVKLYSQEPSYSVKSVAEF